MKIIISPAKKMNICDDDIAYENMPKFMEKTKVLYDILVTALFFVS